MQVQHDLYSESVGMLIRAAKERLSRVESAAEVQTILGSILKPETRFDHRGLQEIHDLIAAQFRFLHRHFLTQKIGDTKRPYELRVAGLWWIFFMGEVHRLLDRPQFMHAILIALAHQDTRLGYEGEEEAARILKGEYIEWLVKDP